MTSPPCIRQCGQQQEDQRPRHVWPAYPPSCIQLCIQLLETIRKAPLNFTNIIVACHSLNRTQATEVNVSAKEINPITTTTQITGPVAYLGGGGLVRGPPPFGRTAVIFVTNLGLFLAPFRDKIAATSDQMRFFGRKML